MRPQVRGSREAALGLRGVTRAGGEVAPEEPREVAQPRVRRLANHLVQLRGGLRRPAGCREHATEPEPRLVQVGCRGERPSEQERGRFALRRDSRLHAPVIRRTVGPGVPCGREQTRPEVGGSLTDCSRRYEERGIVEPQCERVLGQAARELELPRRVQQRDRREVPLAWLEQGGWEPRWIAPRASSRHRPR